MADVKDPQKLVDDIAKQENAEDRAAMNKYVVDPIKKAGRRLYENVMGTPEQNKAAQERMDKAKGKKAGGKIKDPTMMYQTYSKTGKPAGMKTVTVKKASGGSVSSASKRADGCAIKGKTRGKMV
jgi:hypothetical protein